MRYEKFLKKKKTFNKPTGFQINKNDLNKNLFEWQKDIVRWALRKGRACIWADCGMGKTPMQLEWARILSEVKNGPVLILAPLAVSEQTIREGKKFGIHVEHLKGQTFGNPGIYITNYEKLHKFDISEFIGIVLDESSILKSYTGKYRNEIIEDSQYIPFRLACSATPAPNDYTELGNHASFMGVCTGFEMLSMFFINDAQNKQGEKWRLKGHAKEAFFEWVASWAVMISKPSDLGYEDKDFILPELRINHIVVESESPTDGYLFPMEAKTLQERQSARRITIEKRAAMAAEIVNSSDEIFLQWGNLNPECDEMEKKTNGAIQVSGSDKPEVKEKRLLGFSNNEFN